MRQLLLIHLNGAIEACEPRSPNTKDGKYFEVFVYHALHARLVLRCLSAPVISEADQEPLIQVPCTLKSIFPSKTFRLWKADGNKCLIIHQITSKEHLRLFLLTPLYYLSPDGLSELDKIDCSRSGPSPLTT